MSRRLGYGCVWLGTLALVLGAGPRLAHALDLSLAVTQYARRNWSTADGLPQSSVLAILQTRDGYLWMGTEEGLVRFDGVRFTVFDRSNSDGLTSNNILGLAEDGDGAIWLASAGGGVVRFRDGRMQGFRREDGLPTNFSRQIVPDRQGAIWIATEGGGLVRFAGGRFTTLGSREGLPSDLVRAVALGTNGEVWVGTAKGLVRVDGGAITRFGLADGLTHEEIRTLHIDREGTVWVGSDGGGVCRMRGSAIRCYTVKDGLSRGLVRALLRDRAGNLWIGTEGGGLCRLQHENISCMGTKEGLPDDAVRALWEDAEGSLWVGTYMGGLVQLRDSAALPWGPPEGLSHDVVRSILSARDGSLWFGTYGGGISRLKDGKVTRWTKREGMPTDLVYSIAEGTNGALWIGTNGSGVVRFENGVFTTFGPAEVGGPQLRTIYAEPDGTIWAGSEDGVRRFRDGRFEPSPMAGSLPHKTVMAILRSRSGDLWVGTSGGGLARLGGDGRISVLSTRDGLSSDMVFSLLEDPDGTLWIGTYGGGLNRLSNGRITPITSRQGLFNDVVYAIVDDQRGHLWMTCNKGIFRVARESLEALVAGRTSAVKSQAFGLDDGMRTSEPTGGVQGCAMRAPDGRLWAATTKGAVAIDPERLTPQAEAPAVRIESVFVNAKATTPAEVSVVGPGVRNLEVQFTALTYRAPRRVRFRYRLEPLDVDWVDAGTRRAAYYSKLSPGRYVFHVKAREGEGPESVAPATLSFEVAPFFVESRWFKLLGGLFVSGVGLGIVAGGYRVRMRAIAGREQELVRVVAERTRELAEANVRLEQLSRLDPLTNVANRRELDRTLEQEVGACRPDRPLSLVLIDVDHFKVFNDAYGHQAGDECLRRVAATLRAELRKPSDFLGRYGGEEFLVILPATRATAASKVAGRLHSAVRALAIPHSSAPDGRSIVSVSLGVATSSGLIATEALVGRADRALYEAKRRGRDAIVVEQAPPVEDCPGEAG